MANAPLLRAKHSSCFFFFWEHPEGEKCKAGVLSAKQSMLVCWSNEPLQNLKITNFNWFENNEPAFATISAIILPKRTLFHPNEFTQTEKLAPSSSLCRLCWLDSHWLKLTFLAESCFCFSFLDDSFQLRRGTSSKTLSWRVQNHGTSEWSDFAPTLYLNLLQLPLKLTWLKCKLDFQSHECNIVPGNIYLHLFLCTSRSMV